LGKTQPNASVALPELASVFAHERVVTLVKTVLGDDKVVFTGHCDAHMNMLSGWHMRGKGVTTLDPTALIYVCWRSVAANNYKTATG
jgi:hypothetical protein